MPIWGVDSYSPAHLRARGTRGETLYDHVCRFLRQNQRRFEGITAPQFWGRYLSNSRPTSSLSATEKSYLHERGVKILLVYNDTCYDQHRDTDCRRGGRQLELSGYEYGMASARNACQMAASDSLGAPDGTRIYADLEGWFVTDDWLDGWCTEIEDNARRLGRRYLPGIYGRVLVGSELAFARRVFRRESWSISVERAMQERQRQDRMAATGFQRPPAGSRTNTSRERTQSQPRRQPVASRSQVFIWANTPRWNRRCRSVPQEFEAYSTQGGLTRTVVWQYGMDCPNVGHLIDMDIAQPEGFAAMWGPTD
jgi:hypothetical protein